MNFNSIEWHDVAIDKYVIDRSNPGNEDTIQFFLSDYSGKKMKLIFLGRIPIEHEIKFCYYSCRGERNDMLCSSRGFGK